MLGISSLDGIKFVSVVVSIGADDCNKEEEGGREVRKEEAKKKKRREKQTDDSSIVLTKSAETLS